MISLCLESQQRWWQIRVPNWLFGRWHFLKSTLPKLPNSLLEESKRWICCYLSTGGACIYNSSSDQMCACQMTTTCRSRSPKMRCFPTVHVDEEEDKWMCVVLSDMWPGLLKTFLWRIFWLCFTDISNVGFHVLFLMFVSDFIPAYIASFICILQLADHHKKVLVHVAIFELRLNKYIFIDPCIQPLGTEQVL